MITTIGLENFKSIRKRTVILAKPITILIGPNRSGKSSFLQVIALLAQSIRRNPKHLDSKGQFIDLGDIENLVHEGYETEGFSFSIGMQFDNRKNFGFSDDEIRILYDAPSTSFDWNFDFTAKGVLEKINYTVESTGMPVRGKWILGMPRRRGGAIATQIGDLIFSSVDAIFHLEISSKFQSGVDDSKEAWLLRTQEVLRECSKTYMQNNVYYVPPWRGMIQSAYNFTARPVNRLFTNLNADQGSETASTLTYLEELRPIIKESLSNIFGPLELEPSIVHGPQVYIRLRRKGGQNWINLINDGFGVNQLSMVLAQMALAPKFSTVMIEEPEIHLHPRAQAELAEVLATWSLREHKQLLITTHSEHFLSRLLTMVARGDLSPDDLVIYYIELQDNVTEVELLEVDSKGRLPKGLRGFFEFEIDALRDYLAVLNDGDEDAKKDVHS
ncbi:MAG: AAA family ATPase [Candidatus Heimdallarchaeota archaeon]